jgi:hypothetical protein
MTKMYEDSKCNKYLYSAECFSPHKNIVKMIKIINEYYIYIYILYKINNNNNNNNNSTRI